MLFKPSQKQYQALIYLGVVPKAKQEGDKWVIEYDNQGRELYDTEVVEVGYGGAAGGGKSWLGCYWIYIMCRRYPNTRWFIAREEIKKLKESTILTFFDVLRENNEEEGVNYKYDSVNGRIRFDNGSMVFLVGLENQPSDPMFTRFGSTEYTGGFIDEANECPFRGYGILKSRIRYKLEKFCPYCSGEMKLEDRLRIDMVENKDSNRSEDSFIEKSIYLCPHCRRENNGLSPKVLCTFNPDKGWVYSKFYRPFSEGREKHYSKFIPALVTDNKFISRAYIAALKAMEDKVDRERLLYGNFDYDNTPGRLFEYDNLLEMLNRPLDSEILAERYKNDSEYKKLVNKLGECKETGYNYKITCDPARHGRDLAVMYVWNNLSIEEIYVYEYSNMDELERQIMAIVDRLNISWHDVIIDEDGIGGGMVDHLKCRGFINRNPAIQPKKAKSNPMFRQNYGSIKDQCYFTLRDYIKDIAVTKDKIYIYGGKTLVQTRLFKKPTTTLTPDIIRKRIVEELDTMVEIDIDKDGPKRVIRKKEIKEKIGRSNDLSDCFMFRMYWEVKRKRSVFVYQAGFLDG